MSEETRADKVRDSIGKGARVESRRVREPRRTALFWKPRTLLLYKCEKRLNAGLFNFNYSAVKELHYDSIKSCLSFDSLLPISVTN